MVSIGNCTHNMIYKKGNGLHFRFIKSRVIELEAITGVNTMKNQRKAFGIA